MNIADLVSHTIDQCPDRLAVVHNGRRWTYAQLGAHAASLKRKIAAQGFSEGERVVLWMENSAEYIAAYLAVLALRGVVVPVYPQAPAAEVMRTIRHVSATGVIVSRSLWQGMAGEADSENLRFILREGRIVRCRHRGQAIAAPPGLAQIIHTSGSTAQPKGVMLSHRNLIANARSVLAYLRLTADDSILAILPFGYAYGNSVMLTHLLVGGKIVIENSSAYPKVILNQMVEERISGFSGVTSTYAMLFDRSNFNARSFATVRYVTHAGAPLPAELLDRMRSTFSNQRIHLMYGQTEAAPRLTHLPPEYLDRKARSVGRAIPGVSLKIIKDDGQVAQADELGEVWASGENIMLGYWDDARATAKALNDGWLRTGDVGRLDEEGFLTLVGRVDEMIKSGAYRISPAEVEEVLLEHPGVEEAGVVGLQDRLLGEAIHAVVRLKQGLRLTHQDLLAHCAARLAPYKRPKSICLVEAFPRSPSGKILRQGLREISRAALGLPAS